jgi:hypothetical protein
MAFDSNAFWSAMAGSVPSAGLFILWATSVNTRLNDHDKRINDQVASVLDSASKAKAAVSWVKTLRDWLIKHGCIGADVCPDITESEDSQPPPITDSGKRPAIRA